MSQPIVDNTLASMVNNTAIAPILPTMEMPILNSRNHRRVHSGRFTPYARVDIRRLPTLSSSTPADDVSVEQLHRLEPKAIKYMIIAPSGTHEQSDQIMSLRYPRDCVDDDGELFDRFVTDSPGKSGRVYDRLCQREVPRVIPVFRHIVSRMVLDVLTGRYRQRTLMDDMRDMAASKNLEVSLEEAGLGYHIAMDHHYPQQSVED